MTVVDQKSVVRTSIRGPSWLDVEVEFEGKEARFVRAKWPRGSIEVPTEVLHRIQAAVVGSRSAVGDVRNVCQIHGYTEGWFLSECKTCSEEKKALTAPQQPENLLPSSGGGEGPAF